MAIISTICTSFKVDLLKGLHDFTPSTGHVFKLALYPATATLSDVTTVYSPTDEITGTGYTAGGTVITVLAPTPIAGLTTAYVDFGDAIWAASTITNARGGLIYNTNAGANRAVCVVDFGIEKSSAASDFVVIFPPSTSTTAIVRVA